MGSVLQKKKRRSGRQKVKMPNRPKKLLNPLGNDIIAKNWNKKETLTQNYRRLGLTARLKAPTGGVEKRLSQLESSSSSAKPRDPLAIASAEEAVFEEARVERDADGKIVKIHYGSDRRSNPLNDPLNALESDAEDGGEEEEEEGWGGIDDESRPEVIRLLEKEAARPTVKKPRHMSQQEREWLERLVARHGDDVAAMARDRKLNPMQQTEGDIARRIKRLTGKA
ncbi:ribosome biogenesis protein Nop16 [Colletotrichum graminicola]|uniref:Nucleolar protein 16 n=1 Tax=Colletotrichum graminicola (strain M1.001 / M2 / FGSC 10212) TaxID=645133 RepID=E3QAS3_COLGM|nr:ribosome biogenesis protein Nop16 [Colletotrichum graminicola M1.001]EFQ27961.1 ribosome biogenesis protein Nop16 [Colletotrichum graminicola M1.001]WDK12110.1 ribosome biogenesis protein Nop16 [Colletotrichum graminicola]